MGQKVNPHGLRVGVIKDWDSRWYAREDKVGDLVVEDYNIRKYLKNKSTPTKTARSTRPMASPMAVSSRQRLFCACNTAGTRRWTMSALCV